MTRRLAAAIAAAGFAAAILAPAVAAVAQTVDPQSRGEEVYTGECARCHGEDGNGTAWGPTLQGEGAASAYWWVETGRMPLQRPTDPIKRGPAKLSPEDIDAVVAYVGELAPGPALPEVHPDQAQMTTGGELFRLNCAACHGAAGVGGALTAVASGTLDITVRNAPNLFDVSALEVAAAVRSGPGAMPRFGEDTITPDQLDAVVAYVLELQQPLNPGGWSLGRWGPVTEGAVAWLVGIVAFVGGAWWIEGRGRVEAILDGGEEGEPNAS